MTFPRCKTCKWWGPYICCEVPIFKECSYPQDKLCSGTVASDGFGSYDGEPYNGGSFYCGPDFGCVHHTPGKETKVLP